MALLWAQTAPIDQSLSEEQPESKSKSFVGNNKESRAPQSLWIGVELHAPQDVDWSVFDVKHVDDVIKGLRLALNEWFLLNKSSKTLNIVRPAEQINTASLKLYWSLDLQLQSVLEQGKKTTWRLRYSPQYRLLMSNGTVLMEGALEHQELTLDHAHQKQFIHLSSRKLVDAFRSTHQELLASVDQLTQDQKDQFFVEFIDYKNINVVFDALDAWKAELPQIEKVELQYIDDSKAIAELLLIKARMIPISQFNEKLSVIMQRRLKNNQFVQKTLQGTQGLSFVLQ